MEIPNKYFKLLNLLVYDKRNKMTGILTELSIFKTIPELIWFYRMYVNNIYSNLMIFVEDFYKGDVVFLLPFGVHEYQIDALERLADKNEAAIKEFFGDDFREDMIVRISEDERQEQIRKYNDVISGLANWKGCENAVKD